MANPLNQLRELGQSIWLDYIRRDLFDGELTRLIEEDGLAGMTSNPTIFDGAISDSDLYDDDIRSAGRDVEPDAVFERLAVADVQRAADHFRPLYDSTEGKDGFISIEVRPSLAYDADGTVEEVRRLWAACDRPNVMVKIPGTYEGLPAISECLVEGININITLLFSVNRYHEVMDAWFSALEERVDRHLPVDRLASVASFFVSRVDSMVDVRLDRVIEAETGDKRDLAERLKGQTAIANARLAYQAFEERVQAPRFAALAAAGARVQRPLWASTSTKNPEYSDVYYVDSLIGPETVNTLPPKTLDAFRDHGDPLVRIYEDRRECHEVIHELGHVGIDFDDVTRELEKEGVSKFAASYDQLLETIRREQRLVQTA
ncbi:MAG: transaldolase [Gemmatimonadetes bacterium]|nr:transaldolase [Gemmatimonadota bacterium]